MLQNAGVLYILTYKCASRHSGVPFFICLLNSYLRTRRFSEATFRTSGTTNHWKNTAVRDVPITFGARVASFYWLYSRVDLLSSDSTHVLIFLLLTWLLYSAFQLSILSEVRLLNFLRSWCMTYISECKLQKGTFFQVALTTSRLWPGGGPFFAGRHMAGVQQCSSRQLCSVSFPPNFGSQERCFSKHTTQSSALKSKFVQVLFACVMSPSWDGVCS